MCAYFARDPELNLLNPESQKIFRDLIEHLKMGVFMADSHDALFYVNHTFNEIFDFPNHNHATGQNWMHVLFPVAEVRTQFLAKFNSAGYVTDFETTHVNIHGEKNSIIVTTNYIHNKNGKIIGVRGAVINISERRKLEEQLLLEHQKLEEILGFYNNLSDIMELNELNTYIVNQTAQILESKRCSLMFVDAASKELYVTASCGISDNILKISRVKIGDPVAGLIALKSHAILVDNIEYHELFKRQNQKIYSNRSFMSAPLIHNQKLLGIINVSEKNKLFTPTNLKILETIAKQTAINIYKLQTMHNFEHLSQTDPMTGLSNYRYFVQRLEEEIIRASRYSQGLSLMMIDVDNFKTYNDTHGHPNGDKLLKRLAEIFRSNLRSTEHLCRYGGDEFCIILPSTDCVQAAVAAEKLREKVCKEFIQDKVSLSIGVAQFQKNYNKEIFIRQADQALYQAKHSGRNTVIMS